MEIVIGVCFLLFALSIIYSLWLQSEVGKLEQKNIGLESRCDALSEKCNRLITDLSDTEARLSESIVSLAKSTSLLMIDYGNNKQLINEALLKVADFMRAFSEQERMKDIVPEPSSGDGNDKLN